MIHITTKGVFMNVHITSNVHISQAKLHTISKTFHQKMQAKPNNFIPTRTPSSPVKLPPAPRVHRTLSQSKRPKQGVFISTSSIPELVSTTSLPSTTLSNNIETDAFWDYQFLFISQRSETVEPITLSVVDGAIPNDFPLGTYYLTGPGVFKDDHGSTIHPLDGHGYLRAFTIDGDTKESKFIARYVNTEAQVEECDPKTGSWQFTHRGPFSVLKGGHKIGNTKVMKNVANTSVLVWGGKLMCLWEGGDPYEIEPGSLDTVGKLHLMDNLDSTDGKKESNGGVWDVVARLLKPILYGVFKMPPKRLLSHYKIDAKRNRLLLMSCNAEDMLLPSSHFSFYEYDSSLKLLRKHEYTIPDQMMIHDWAFTDTHYILFANRIKLDVAGSMVAVCGFSPMISALAVNPSKKTSPIYLLPRSEDPGSRVRDWKVPIEAPSQLWVLHIANAFEERHEDGGCQIIIHASACSYQWFNFQKMFGYDWQTGKLDPAFMNKSERDKGLLPHLIQVSINLHANGDGETCSAEKSNNWTSPSDFPVINPAYSGSENKYIYAATCSGVRHSLPHFPFDTVVKLNVLDGSAHTWTAGPRKFIGEPIFVRNGVAEDDGYLLVVEYAVAIQRCYLVILDPKQIGEAGALVARLEVPRHFNFPLGFHGFWALGNNL